MEENTVDLKGGRLLRYFAKRKILTFSVVVALFGDAQCHQRYPW